MKKPAFFTRNSRLFPFIFGCCLIFCLTTCTNERITVKSTSWKEFHGNSLNSGFTNFPGQPAEHQKWSFPLGASNASAIVDDNGVVYIGNNAGFLFAVKPDGSEQWRVNLGGILTPAALGADGNIYVSNIVNWTTDVHFSILFSVTATVTQPKVNWIFLFPDNGYSTAPPKTWSNGASTFIFITAHTNLGAELFVIDKDGKLLARTTADCKPDELEGGDIGGFHVQGIDIPVFQEPAVAIADIPGTTTPGRPVIVIAPNKCHLMAFEWNPESKVLRPLWTAPGAYFTNPSPAITQGGEVIFGHKQTLSKYELMKGTKVWDFQETSLITQYSFYDTPAILVGTTPIIFDNHGYVLAVENDGKKFRRFSTQQSGDLVGPPPIAAFNFIYAAFNSGLFTLDLNLNQVAHVPLNHDPNNNIISSPAIGPDGTIYIVDGAGQLVAFGANAAK